MPVLNAAFSKGSPVDAIYSKGQLVYQNSPYSPEARALFARMDEQPSDADKGFINGWLAQAKPYLDKFDFFYVCCLPTLGQCTSGGKLLCWNDPAYDGDLVGTVNFVGNAGLKGDGSTFYVDTHFLPNGSTKYSQNAGTIGGVIQDTDGTATKVRYLLGYGGTNGSTRIQFQSSAFNFGQDTLNNAALAVYTYTPMTNSHMTLTRTGTALKLFRDANSISSYSAAAVDISGWNTGSFRLFGQYNASTGLMSQMGFQRSSAFFCGGYLTDTETNNWFYLLNSLLAYFGAEPVVNRPYSFMSVALGPKNLQTGNTVTYNITRRVAAGTSTGSMDIAVEGDLTDADFNTPFLTALANAVSSTTGVTLAGNTLTFTDAFTGPLTFSRTLTSNPANGEIHSVRLSNEVGLNVETPFAAQICGTVSVVATPSQYKGINMSGDEFGTTGLYFSTLADIQPYIDIGVTCMRLPFKWELIQPVLYGPLDNTVANKIKTQINLITGNGMYCAPEFHNFGGRGGLKIGDSGLPVSAWLDVVKKFIQFIGNDNTKLIFGMMNEPVIDGNIWRAAAKATTDQVRALGFNNEIWVPGSGFTGAHDWVSSGNGTRFADFTDPITDIVVHDMHQYLDADNAGDDGQCSIGSSTRIDAAFAWCAANNRKVVIGEYGCGSPTTYTQCATELPAMMAKMYTDPVCKGGMSWGAGPFWASNYFMRFMTSVAPIIPTDYGQTVVNNWPT